MAVLCYPRYGRYGLLKNVVLLCEACPNASSDALINTSLASTWNPGDASSTDVFPRPCNGFIHLHAQAPNQECSSSLGLCLVHAVDLKQADAKVFLPKGLEFVHLHRWGGGSGGQIANEGFL